jgi:hypothetical protein
MRARACVCVCSHACGCLLRGDAFARPDAARCCPPLPLWRQALPRDTTCQPQTPTPNAHQTTRLTQNVADGCGVSGVEGGFRRAAEITLQVYGLGAPGQGMRALGAGRDDPAAPMCPPGFGRSSGAGCAATTSNSRKSTGAPPMLAHARVLPALLRTSCRANLQDIHSCAHVTAHPTHNPETPMPHAVTPPPPRTTPTPRSCAPTVAPS